jgi:predicted Zn-dependent protease
MLAVPGQGLAQIPDSPPAIAAPPSIDVPVSSLPSIPAEIEDPPVTPPNPGAGHPEHVKNKYDVSHIGERGVGQGVNLYSLERERAMGQELAHQVEAQSHMVTDPIITEYINRIAQTLVRNSDARVPFTVRVLDDDEVNAFALPGGYFFVNSGLILAADNEAQLACVMAHEVAHVAARHATKNATRMEIFNMASIPLIFFGGPAVYAVRQAASIAMPMSMLKFSRDAEREADLLGMEYAYATGYDPAEFVHFFEALRSKQKEKLFFVAKAFATHPMTADRIKHAQQEIDTMLPAKDQYVVSTSEFDEIKARLRYLQSTQRISAGNSSTPVLRKRTH